MSYQHRSAPAPVAAPQPVRKSRTAILVGLGLGAALLCLITSVAGIVLLRGRILGGAEPAPEPTTWEEHVLRIDGVVDYRAGLTEDELTEEPVAYAQDPPVGGRHSSEYHDCDGRTYQAPLVNEKAVHSLEHGTAWITYRPGLSAEDVQSLAKIASIDHTMLSPYPGLDKPISVQAWGFQLKVDSADDPRIAEFVFWTADAAGPDAGGPCVDGTIVTR